MKLYVKLFSFALNIELTEPNIAIVARTASGCCWMNVLVATIEKLGQVSFMSQTILYLLSDTGTKGSMTPTVVVLCATAAKIAVVLPTAETVYCELVHPISPAKSLVATPLALVAPVTANVAPCSEARFVYEELTFAHIARTFGDVSNVPTMVTATPFEIEASAESVMATPI